MGIFDFFDSSKKIYRWDFRKALRQISVLSDKERAYTEKMFESDLEGGLSKFEIAERCRRIMHQPGDILEPGEVEKIKEKLLKYFE